MGRPHPHKARPHLIDVWYDINGLYDATAHTGVGAFNSKRRWRGNHPAHAALRLWELRGMLGPRSVPYHTAHPCIPHHYAIQRYYTKLTCVTARQEYRISYLLYWLLQMQVTLKGLHWCNLHNSVQVTPPFCLISIFFFIYLLLREGFLRAVSGPWRPSAPCHREGIPRTPSSRNPRP